ncbi:MAG TPA: SdpI family protein [Blastocatellia bacterium]|nr:SdpI family protein [Blastocatellia bacterium]
MPIYGYLLMASDVALILAGATMYWFSPRMRRNWVLGYGSARSMINDATWQAANRFAGITLALLTLLGMLLQVSLWQMIEANDLVQTVAAGSTLSLPLFVMYLTERHLARRFRS